MCEGERVRVRGCGGERVRVSVRGCEGKRMRVRVRQCEGTVEVFDGVRVRG